MIKGSRLYRGLRMMPSTCSPVPSPFMSSSDFIIAVA